MYNTELLLWRYSPNSERKNWWIIGKKKKKIDIDKYHREIASSTPDLIVRSRPLDSEKKKKKKEEEEKNCTRARRKERNYKREKKGGILAEAKKRTKRIYMYREETKDFSIARTDKGLWKA